MIGEPNMLIKNGIKSGQKERTEVTDVIRNQSYKKFSVDLRINNAPTYSPTFRL